jgi:hypothetical protein
MKIVTILDDEIRELLLERKTISLLVTGEITFEPEHLTVSAAPAADDAADVHVSAHDVWDAEVGGGVQVRARSGEMILLRAPKKGFDGDPLAISREDCRRHAALLAGYWG